MITDVEIVSLEETLARIDAVHRLTRWPPSPASCSRPKHSLRRGSARARSGSGRRWHASTLRRGSRGMKVCLFGAGGQSRRGPRAWLLTACRVTRSSTDAGGGGSVGCRYRRRLHAVWTLWISNSSTPAWLRACRSVIGTTGFRPLDRVGTSAAREAGVPCFFAPNFALGRCSMMRFAAEASPRAGRRQRSWRCTTRRKLDSPSGYGEGDGSLA